MRKNDTLHLAWAVASEQMKTKFFWVLSVTHSCDLRPNQLSKRKFSSMLQCEQFFAHFSKNLSIQKLFWVVAIMVTGQLKTTKPYLWQLQLISQTLHEFLQRPCCLSQTLALKMSWNTWTIRLRVHKYGFVLLNRLRIATTQFSATEKQQIIEKEEKAVPQNIFANTLLPKWLKFKSDYQVIPGSQKMESWFLSTLAQKLQFKRG